MSDNISRRQHYIPRFYLRQLLDKFRIFLKLKSIGNTELQKKGNPNNSIDRY